VTILAVTGLRHEQRLLAGPDVEVVAGGGDLARLEAALDRLAPKAAGIISIGIAGALSPRLRVGDWVVAAGVRGSGEFMPTDPRWANRLGTLLPGAVKGTLLGADAMASTAALKAELYRTTGADAVDMESHVVARVARRCGVAFAAARVISDAADRTLPPAARVAMRSDGRIDAWALLRSLAAQPWQLPALIRTGIEARQAFDVLRRGRRLLGAGLGGPDLGELPADMV
jgi:adenosylhomocysteine nucleosidase